MATKTRLTQAQRETLQELLRAAAKATAAAAALKAAQKELETAERAALPILSEPQRIKDENGTTRTISIILDKSYTRGGTTESRLSFARAYGLKTTEPDCTTGTLKTMKSAAIAAGVLVPVPCIVID